LEDKLKYERRALQQGFQAIVGIDEAGRGPLAGPVVAAACHISPGVRIEGIEDSKKLTPAKRVRVYRDLIEHSEVLFGIGIVDAEVIDQINILQATIMAMLTSIENIPIEPDYLLVDGMTLPVSIPCEKIIKGDSLSLSIGAASIIAKVTRDALMHEYDERFPEYGFGKHKGYGTKMHMDALKEFGPCPRVHRESFEPVRRALHALK